MLKNYSDEVLDAVNTNVRYEGYLKQQEEDIEKMLRQEESVIPDNINYQSLKGLRLEARQKLELIKPKTIAQASRISGVSPADIQILIIHIKLLKDNQ